MEDLSLHILDIVENATAAGATRVAITIRCDPSQDLLEIIIADNVANIVNITYANYQVAGFWDILFAINA